MNVKGLLFLSVVLTLVGLAWSPAQAGGPHVGIGINIPLGGPAYRPYPYYGYPNYYPYAYPYAYPYGYPYYVAPQPVYVAPPPAYVQPAPVYAQPAPAAQQYYYPPTAPAPAPQPTYQPAAAAQSYQTYQAPVAPQTRVPLPNPPDQPLGTER